MAIAETISDAFHATTPAEFTAARAHRIIILLRWTAAAAEAASDGKQAEVYILFRIFKIFPSSQLLVTLVGRTSAPAAALIWKSLAGVRRLHQNHRFSVSAVAFAEAERRQPSSSKPSFRLFLGELQPPSGGRNASTAAIVISTHSCNCLIIVANFNWFSSGSARARVNSNSLLNSIAAPCIQVKLRHFANDLERNHLIPRYLYRKISW